MTPLFDLSPKETARSLYGRERELDHLVRLTDAGRWSAVLGPRMVGKTSLVKAAIAASRRSGIYVNLWGAKGTLGLLSAFVQGLNSSRSILGRIRAGLRRVEGVTLGPAGVSIAPQARPLRTMWDLVGLVGDEAGRSVIALDEVQELAGISGPLLKALGNLFNTHREVVFIFTGSYFGLIRTLLDPRSDSPLFGRAPVEVRLGPFERAASLSFLSKGFREYHRELDATKVGPIVDRTLDGVPGWLTLFGNSVVVQRLSLYDAEAATVRDGKKVARSEVAHFLQGRPAEAYWHALRLMVSEIGWTELRNGLTNRAGTPVNDHSVGNLLRALRAADLIVEKDQRYSIGDPMIRRYVAEARSMPRPEG